MSPELEGISVVVPASNAARTIAACLSAILEQDYPSTQLEVIAVDNASTDGTAAAIARFAPRVTLLTARKKGASAARNAGARAAKFSCIAFIDADCVPGPGWLCALHRTARAHPQAGLVGGLIEGRHPRSVLERYVDRLYDQRSAILVHHPPYAISANMLVRREVFGSIGFFDEHFLRGQDVELSWRAFHLGGHRFAYAPDAVVRHEHLATLPELFHKGLQHGRAAAWVYARYAPLLKRRRRDRAKRVDAYGRLLEESASMLGELFATGGAPAPAALERFYASVFAAGKQLGFVCGTLATSGPLRARIGTLSGLETNT